MAYPCPAPPTITLDNDSAAGPFDIENRRAGGPVSQMNLRRMERLRDSPRELRLPYVCHVERDRRCLKESACRWSDSVSGSAVCRVNRLRFASVL